MAECSVAKLASLYVMLLPEQADFAGPGEVSGGNGTFLGVLGDFSFVGQFLRCILCGFNEPIFSGINMVISVKKRGSAGQFFLGIGKLHGWSDKPEGKYEWRQRALEGPIFLPEDSCGCLIYGKSNRGLKRGLKRGLEKELQRS